MRNPFAFLFKKPSTTYIGTPSLAQRPRQEWEVKWEALAKEWPVGTRLRWLDASMHVVGIQNYQPGYYPHGLPSLPPQQAGYRMEYADKNGVVREYFMPAAVALAYFKK